MEASAFSILPHPDVEHLRCRTAASGFRNVYRSRGKFVARVKEGGKLRFLSGSRCRLAHQSALFVVEWYRKKFGPNWMEAVTTRCRRYWHPWYSELYRGWLVNVWVKGSIRTLFGKDGDPLVFDSRSQAVVYVRALLARKREKWGAWRNN